MAAENVARQGNDLNCYRDSDSQQRGRLCCMQLTCFAEKARQGQGGLQRLVSTSANSAAAPAQSVGPSRFTCMRAVALVPMRKRQTLAVSCSMGYTASGSGVLAASAGK